MDYFNSIVISNTQITSDIFVLCVENKDLKINPGQFFMLKNWKQELTLMRPISVFKTDVDKISFMYRVVGQGTHKLTVLKEGDELQLLGPCGNGYPVSLISGKVAVVGGGVGIPPLCQTAKILQSAGVVVDAYLGFRDVVFAIDDFIPFCENVHITTENGSSGKKGFVTDFLPTEKYDVVITCGPEIMMRKVGEMCGQNKVKCYCSLEHRMACGIGACLGCSIKTTDGMKRVCKDGPVFDYSTLIW